ncbi:hypothetical protein EYF80_000214 [Liparis tanakae]|uniref:Uncharacterized protein n=1 Tax=Liparis tanakae TaxID=230148 RepID=A0A4Z2JI57_9TELE|nr:hypothetical protein EYF80_000214 [Liparis tanakae]
MLTSDFLSGETHATKLSSQAWLLKGVLVPLILGADTLFCKPLPGAAYWTGRNAIALQLRSRLTCGDKHTVDCITSE